MIEYIIIYTTTNSKEEAEKISNILIEKKYAACIQVSEIESKYWWKGKVETDKEFKLAIKTRKDRYKDVENEILTNHSYDVPEIVSVNIEFGSDRYLDWINEEVH